MNSKALTEKKIKRISELVEKSGADSIVLISRGNFLYLTGIDAGGAVYINPSSEEYVALVPLMEFWKVSDALDGKMSVYAVSKIAFSEDPDYPIIFGNMGDALSRFLEKDSKVALDIELSQLQQQLREKLEGKNLVDARKEISLARRRKMEEEVELIKKASELTEKALQKTLNSIENGITEKELYAELMYNLYKGGADGLAFEPIVAFEENASNPHALPGNKKLRKGNAVVIDTGAKFSSYCSDMTRTILFYAQSYRPLLESLISSYYAALDSIRPEVSAKEVDLQARKVLSFRKLEKYFIHSLGHGVGVEVHESPNISPASDDILLNGDVITLEPGFYIPRKLGMRIENTVVVTEKGGEPLNKLDLLIEIS